MELLSNLGLGLSTSLTPLNLLYCLIGVFLGTLIGVLPGLGPTATIAMLLPVTFTLPPVSARSAIRINAGATTPLTDASGNAWLPDQGFTEGEVSDRGNDLTIANTKDPALYRTERYSMTAFSQPLPNGKYVVKLHFAETYEQVTAAGERVFTFDVEGKVVKDFDVFARAGGGRKAYVETVTIEVADGKLDIVFTSQVQNPTINGIEIIPAS